jgi:hypothetical protein
MERQERKEAAREARKKTRKMKAEVFGTAKEMKAAEIKAAPLNLENSNKNNVPEITEADKEMRGLDKGADGSKKVKASFAEDTCDDERDLDDLDDDISPSESPTARTEEPEEECEGKLK